MFEREIKLYPLWNKRNVVSNKNYGIPGVELHFLLKGELGTVDFSIYTNLFLEKLEKENLSLLAKRPFHDAVCLHSKNEVDNNDLFCCYTCGDCYLYEVYDSRIIYSILLEKGSDGVWSKLEEIYESCYKLN